MSDNTERRSYPLRQGVAKPAVIYQPTMGPAKEKEPGSPTSKASAAPGGKAAKTSGGASSSGASGSGAAGTKVERVLGKRRRSGRTEFLVKWVGKDQSANSWEPGKSVDPALIEQYDEVRTACLHGSTDPLSLPASHVAPAHCRSASGGSSVRGRQAAAR